MGDMTKPPAIRKTIILPPEDWERVDTFRHARRLKTELEALRILVRAGLDALEAKKNE